MFSVICSSRSSRTSVFEEEWYTTRSTKMVCRSIAASSVAYRKKCGCSPRPVKRLIRELRGHDVSKAKQLTVRKSLHRKFSLDPPCGLHDLAKARENIIVLKEVKTTQLQKMPACHTSERTSRRIWRSFDCSIVSKHACTSTFTKYNFGLIVGSLTGEYSWGRWGGHVLHAPGWAAGE